jgi:hypothetical protein
MPFLEGEMMATRSRARTFHATARALNEAAQRRVEGPLQDLDIAIMRDAMDEGMIAGTHLPASPDHDDLGMESVEVPRARVDNEALRALEAERRWAESTLMQASEALAEAQEAGRKDLVALERMRRELRRSLAAESSLFSAQHTAFSELAPRVQAREDELAELVEQGAPTAPVLRDLAALRAERKLLMLGMAQISAQIALIRENQATLEHAVRQEAFDLETNGQTMAELARLRSEERAATEQAARAGRAARELLDALDLDTSSGEITAVGAFLAAELTGDERAAMRMRTVRERQMRHELAQLPEPASGWRTGLLHPVSWMRARRVTR